MSEPALTDQERDEMVSDVLTVLADEHRRHVLRYFETANAETATLGELADYVLDVSDQADCRRSVQIALHHKVLPTLEEAGWLTYDARTHTVTHLADSTPTAPWIG